MKKLIAFQVMFIFALFIGVNLMAQTGTPGLAYTLISNGTAYSVAKGTATASEIVIPEIYESLPVTQIATDGFSATGGGVSNLTAITIPNSITNIREFAFSGCSNLASLTIPINITSIGTGAFGDCSNLTSITLPGVSIIGNSAFALCSRLSSITLLSATSIGERAFNDCSSLTSIIIPAGVRSIRWETFKDCSSLANITTSWCYTNRG